jgi:hypothetical protein
MLDFASLWQNHPANGDPPELEPCKDSEGVSHFENQCAIRMSVCLVRSGVRLDSFRGAFCWFGHHREHALRAEEVAAWLDSPLADFVPSADIAKSSAGPISSSLYAGRRGIVLFRNFWGTGQQGDHIDLWDGEKMSHGNGDYFERSQEVWFWDLD